MESKGIEKRRRMINIKNRERRNIIKSKLKWKGFWGYLYKIMICNVVLVLLPIFVLGMFWLIMVSNQVESNFYQHKTIQMKEVTSGVLQRIQSIKMELSAEKQDKKYSTYTYTKDYALQLRLISKRLSAMVENHPILSSVYFYNALTSRIYNSNSGGYDFHNFYDKNWIAHTKKAVSIQLIPIRYSLDEEYYNKINSNRNNEVFHPNYEKILTLVLRGKPDFYLVANLSLNELYQEILHNYNLNEEGIETLFVGFDGNIIEGNTDRTEGTFLMENCDRNSSEVQVVKHNNRIYFLKIK